MKKVLTLIITIAFSTAIFSQDEISYPNQDSTMFYWWNGYEDIVEVDFYTKIDSLPEEVWEKVVLDALVASKMELKNELSFVPIQVGMALKDGKITLLSKFLGKNSYGAESKSSKFYYFTEKGEWLDK